MEERTRDEGVAQNIRSRELQRGPLESLADYPICICMRRSYSKLGIKPSERNRGGEMTSRTVTIKSSTDFQPSSRTIIGEKYKES